MLRPDTPATRRAAPGAWQPERRRSYRLAFLIVVGLKLLALAWLLPYAARALLQG